MQELLNAIRDTGLVFLNAGPERIMVALSRLILDFDLLNRDKELFRYHISAVSRSSIGGLLVLSFDL